MKKNINELLEFYADIVAGNISQWEMDNLTILGKTIGDIGKMSKEEAERVNSSAEAEKQMKRIKKGLAKVTLLNASLLLPIFQKAFEGWHERNEALYQYRGLPFIPAREHKIIQETAKQYARSAAENMIEASKTKALSLIDANKNVVNTGDGIRKALDKALKTIQEGKSDFYTATRDTVESLGGYGMRVKYADGISRRLDTVVRQDLLYQLKMAHRAYNQVTDRELKYDGIEISYSENPRLSHQFMQGKQYSKGDAKTVNGVYYPSAVEKGVYDRLYKDYNCYHEEHGIILGVTVPVYSAEQIADLDARNNKKYTINGREYSRYECGQEMRRLEAEIRKQKGIKQVALAEGNKALVKRANERIRACKTKYNEITGITGLDPQPRRMQIGKIQENLQNTLDFSGNSGIMYSDNEFSELGKFKSRIQSDNNMSNDYYSVVKERFSHGTDYAKSAFNKYIPINSIADSNYTGIPHYDSDQKKIYMNYLADSDNPRGNGITYFHEHGHMLDDLIGKKSNNPEFLSLLELDRIEYAKAYGKKNSLKTWSKVDEAISKDLNSMRKHSGVSDIYDGLTKGNIKGVAGHPIEYWEKEGNLQAEAFAHMYASQFDELRYAEMKKYFPKSLEWFENVLKEVFK